MKKERFKFDTNHSRGVFLYINSGFLDETIEFIKERKIKNITINEYWGYRRNDLKFLQDVDFIEKIIITGEVDISSIKHLHKLKYLQVDNEKQGIDFSRFPELAECTFTWNKKIENLSTCSNLNVIRIDGLKQVDLVELPELPNLKEFQLVQSTIHSLKGIEKYSKLKRVELHYLRNLKSVKGIELLSGTLEHFELGHVKKIEDIDSVKKLEKLKVLAINDCGNIQSLCFIKDMPNLKDVRFVGTNVLDGNLTHCIGLDYVGFDNKRHYSHKFEELNPRKAQA